MKRPGLKTLFVTFALTGLAVALVDYAVYRWYFGDADAVKEKAGEKSPQEKPAFEFPRLSTSWSEPSPANGCYKPGHWTDAFVEARANDRDFVGNLLLSAVDREGAPQAAAGVSFELTGARPLALVKEQAKQFSMPLVLPLSPALGAIQCEGESRHTGLAFERRELLARMPAYQYHWVVLARRPDRYAYLANLPFLRPLHDTPFVGATLPLYRIVRYPGDQRPPLPAASLFWTSVAVFLWDDASPDALDLEQRQALVDWLHWGGLLIVNGPSSLDALSRGFLAPYLPAVAAGPWTLTDRDAAPLAAYVDQPAPGAPPVPPRWSGVKLRLTPEARFVDGCGALFAERQVGRGRVLASAVRLDARPWSDWPGADALIRRKWVRFEWQPTPPADPLAPITIPPRAVSQVRYFTRDAGGGDGEYLPPPKPTDGRLAPTWLEEEPPGTGVAAWNDASPAALAARHCLASAARVRVPDRRFVVAVLIAYLLAIAPLNWLAFRALGRVQWAWAAAPLIAVAFAAAVIHFAELDVGFVRLRTEIAVVEGCAGYPRAHITRYVALYSSLTTRYELRFPDDPAALALAFPKSDAPTFDPDPQTERALRRMLERRDRDTLVDGFLVGSNSTGMLHSEQVRDLGGAVLLSSDGGGRWRLENRTSLAIEQAVVTRKTAGDEVQSAWVEQLAPGASLTVEFHTFAVGKGRALPWSAERDRSPLTAARDEQGAIQLRGLTTLAEDPAQFEPFETRLVGLLAAAPAGLEIQPAAAQSRSAALVVWRLDAKPPTAARLARAPQ